LPQLAQSSSDFGNVLQDAQNKMLRIGYVEVGADLAALGEARHRSGLQERSTGRRSAKSAT
jgi:hypothetical protein